MFRSMVKINDLNSRWQLDAEHLPYPQGTVAKADGFRLASEASLVFFPHHLAERTAAFVRSDICC